MLAKEAHEKALGKLKQLEQDFTGHLQSSIESAINQGRFRVTLKFDANSPCFPLGIHKIIDIIHSFAYQGYNTKAHTDSGRTTVYATISWEDINAEV